MITSFFKQAKPIHFVLIGTFLLMVFIASKMYVINEPLTFTLVLKQGFYFGIVLSSLFLLDFFASRNSLTKKNSYKLLMFGLFMAMLPETLLNSNTLLANFFILLALRRIISLRTQKDTQKKLFDAAFWISIATLLYFWAILFFVLIFAAMILYSIVNVKNWIIPLTGVLAVIIIWVSWMLLTNNDFTDFFDQLFVYNFDFTGLNSARIIISTTILISYGTWGSFYFIKHLKDKSKNLRPSFMLIVISSIISLLIILISPYKDGSEFIFLFAPLAIIMTNYLEVTKEKWFQEVLVWVLVLIPAVFLIL
ncbi:DUF6427 family protein [Subsaxibacter sp. CAU 1640]|uniref:DUF6427 family protein n=1 Tax=Subsaxibacter sp. CAU 1640 TaxID=2933271 RepID=UPI002003DB6D|nr:DUF6427 family protein [Subsaxibacter sp. CAU 1640]MCK7589543.1 DUF6427 family protein [Subsaxibacter sp. CAU 1640]